MEKLINLNEIKELIGRANRQVSVYREKYSKFFEKKELNKSDCPSESMSISNLKNFLSKVKDKDMKVFTFNESDLSDSGICISNNTINLSGNRTSVDLKSFSNLVSTFKSGDFIRINDNKILKSIKEEGNNIILNIADVSN